MPKRVAIIVDDEPLVRTYVNEILISYGFHTLEATNGNEALLLVQSLTGRVDLIVSDVQMPGGDGVALAYAVAKSYPGIPLILMSAFPAPSITVPVECLKKPFVPAKLMEIVQRVCPRKSTSGGGQVP